MYQDEHPVPPELARALIASQFPQLAPIRLSLAGEGWDNLVYRVNDRWVFRFPRRRLAVECLRHELAVTPRLERRLPLPISAPRFFGKPTEPYPHPFAGYDWLNGVTADSLRLDDAARSALAGPLGHFLRALHDVTGEEARSWGAPGDLIGRMDLAMRAPRTKEHLRTLHERNVLPATAPWIDVIDRVLERHRDAGTLAASRDTAVHGDLYARHLFVTVPAGDGDSDAKRLELGASDTGASDAGASDASASDTGASDTGASDASPPSGMGRSIALSAIIDWGDVHAGDPAVDLSIAVGFLPPTARTVFAAAYGPIDDETWERARFRAIQHAAVTAVYAHDVGDADWLEESLRSLTHATL